MQKCPKCIGFGSDSSNFCSICGTKMEPLAFINCECGKQLVPGTKYCHVCGKKQKIKKEKKNEK